jgi:hypothetical protein
MNLYIWAKDLHRRRTICYHCHVSNGCLKLYPGVHFDRHASVRDLLLDALAVLRQREGKMWDPLDVARAQSTRRYHALCTRCRLNARVQQGCGLSSLTFVSVKRCCDATQCGGLGGFTVQERLPEDSEQIDTTLTHRAL